MPVKELVKQALPPPVLRAYRHFKLRRLKPEYGGLITAQVFNKVYESAAWGRSSDSSVEYFSGSGSHAGEIVTTYVVAVRAFLLRGERLRAHEWHSLWVIGGLTRLARHAEGAPQPPAAARRAELDLSPALLARLSACAGGIGDLSGSWTQALHLAEELAAHLGLEARTELIRALRL